MRPMQLKEPAKCCGTPTLVWVAEKHYFVCPCGEMKVSESGRVLKGKTNFNYFFKKKRPDETADKRRV